MTRNVVITGAFGFIGRHVARHYAAENRRVVGLGHGMWSRGEWRDWGLAEWHDADVTFDALEAYADAPEFIVHCAGGGSVGFSIDRPYDDFQRSVQTTISTLEYIRVRSPSTRFVLLSSAAVYGNANDLPIIETAPLVPISPYGLHKRMAEDVCLSYADRYGVKSAIVRLFSVYGPGLRKQLLWDACEKLRRGDGTFAGTGRELRDWLHVTDTAALIAVAARYAAAKCPTVNGGSGEATTVSEVLHKLAATFPHVRQVKFSGVPRVGDPVGFQADTARARSWGWQPNVSLDVGIAEYATWYGGRAT